MQGQLIQSDSPVWGDCLDRLAHDVYHKPEYVRLCAQFDGGEATAFVVEDGNALFFVPLLLQKIPSDNASRDDWFDAVSPYGYPCPLSNSTDHAFVSRALQHMRQCLREQGVVSAFLRFHPLLPLPLDPFRHDGTLIQHGETVFCDLTRSEEVLWNDVRRTTRNEIDRVRRNGYVAEHDTQWRYLDDFIASYWETMQRAAASDAYFFPSEYFHTLKNTLGDSAHLFVVRLGDEIACAGIETEVGGIVQAHLAGVRTEFCREQPLKLMLDAVRQWAKLRGNRAFHLGGGLGGKKDSLFNFKAAFAKSRADFYTWRSVVNPDAFQSLVSRWEEDSRESADDMQGYFPPYRKAMDPQVQ